MKSGDAIPREKELSDTPGVSRSVLREALSLLRMLGLIESRTRQGIVFRKAIDKHFISYSRFGKNNASQLKIHC